MKKSILICDDEEGIRESLKLILEKDYDLSFVSNGLEAITSIKMAKYDLIILDIKMPKVSGVDTLREIKKISPKHKVIVATGYKSPEVVREVAKLGVNDYVVKPFNIEEVKDKVRKLLL
jgi:YesN/AraC family two-component response regulator